MSFITRQIGTIDFDAGITEAMGDFASDYDYAAVRDAVRADVRSLLPDGVYVCGGGDRGARRSAVVAEIMELLEPVGPAPDPAPRVSRLAALLDSPLPTPTTDPKEGMTPGL